MNFHTINRGVNKRLHSYFAYNARKIQYGKKVKKAIQLLNCDRLTNSQIAEAKEYYASLGFRNINTDWHRYFTHVSGNFYKEYMPEDIFHNIVEPNLNMFSMLPALTDKNLLSKLFIGVKQTKTVVKNINGFFYERGSNSRIGLYEAVKKCQEYSKLVIKPTIGSFGGKDVVVFNVEGDKTDFNNLSIESLIKLYKDNFIIQEFLLQHEQMGLLNSSSVNTIRSTTLLIDNRVEILRDMVRVGCKGSVVDNASQGGLWCIINEGGKLDERGYFDPGIIVLETDSKVKLKDFEIPNYKKIKQVIRHLHMQIPYFKIVSWDIAIDREGDAVLIEYNVQGQGIDDQYAYSPLFKEFTDRILKSCKINKFSKSNSY